MKNILIPTDFSNTSRNAFQYALKLAEYIKADSINIVHVFLPETAGEADFIPPVAQLMKSRQTALDNFVEELLEEAGSTPCSIGHEVLVGFPADELVQASEEYSFIVMGTTGQSGVLEKIFGSVSSSVSQRAYCPVLLVPKDARFRPLKHIIYASNYESASQEMIEKLAGFNQHFNAHIHFVHVRQQKGTSLTEINEAIFKKAFEKGEPSFAFEITEVEGEDITAGISQYADEKDAELAVMVTRHRNFWQSILHRSQTKKMALATHIPLMVLHMADEE